MNQELKFYPWRIFQGSENINFLHPELLPCVSPNTLCPCNEKKKS